MLELIAGLLEALYWVLALRYTFGGLIAGGLVFYVLDGLGFNVSGDAAIFIIGTGALAGLILDIRRGLKSS